MPDRASIVFCSSVRLFRWLTLPVQAPKMGPRWNVLPLCFSARMDELLGLIIRLLWLIPIGAVLLILTAAAWYASQLIREHLAKTELKPTDYLESFRKLHEEGKLTTEEFRIIKRLVSLQMTRSPDTPKQGEPNIDYSLLNRSPPSQSTDRPSGNFPKN